MLIGAYIFFFIVRVTKRYLCREIGKSQGFEYIQHQVDHALEFGVQLVRRTKNVRVVLSEASNSCQSVKLPALLVTVYRSKFSKTLRKVLVTPGTAVVDLAVVRTVHGLQKEFLPLVWRVDGLKAILPVLRVMPRGHV